MTPTHPTAVVTGASSGIGGVYADRLAARGYGLVLIARRQDRLDALAEQLRQKHGVRIETVSADLTLEDDLASVEALVRNVPDLALVANIAGSGVFGASPKLSPAKIEAMLKLNVLALTRLSLAAASRFAQARSGTLINISSILAAMPMPGAGAYSGSKSYVLNFTQGLQTELGPLGVRIQTVLPGPVRTEFFGDTPAPFPDGLFMSADTLVDTALAALDQGETVTFPNLQDLADLERFEAARGALIKGVTQSGKAASRYSIDA